VQNSIFGCCVAQRYTWYFTLLCTKSRRILLCSLGPVDCVEAEYRGPVHRDASLHLVAAKPPLDPIEAHRLEGPGLRAKNVLSMYLLNSYALTSIT
jgi:hypothetical protein